MTSLDIRRLDHVSLNVSDRPRSIAWYRDVLGLEQRGNETRNDWPVFMGPFGACIALFQAEIQSPERQAASTGLLHIAFMVGREGFDRAQLRLAERDIEFEFEDHGTAHAIYFSDPDGNVIELTTYETSPRDSR